MSIRGRDKTATGTVILVKETTVFREREKQDRYWYSITNSSASESKHCIQREENNTTTGAVVIEKKLQYSGVKEMIPRTLAASKL